jgi:tripartite-type tricarboxylate transporter receptor subunit TctC
MSFAPITRARARRGASFCATSRVIAVNSASPYHTLVELLDAARARPGDLTLASVGPATLAHLAIEMLKRLAHVDMTFVPYSGAPLAVNALLGEHVTAFFGSYPNVALSLSAGKLRARDGVANAHRDAA